MRYQNPVIPGFYPDPSICRVGDDYYLVTSSFEYFPGVPVFYSRDLVHWRQIGHCLTRLGQLNLENAPSSGGIFAPTIRYHAGRFYMVTTNFTHGGNFYVWTDDPAGEWSDPIWVDQGGIDPSLCFDDEGKVYFTSNGGGDERGIHQCEIEIATGRRLTESRFIWPGTGGAYPEAPHLYKINGLYYLMIAEGGTEYGHMETIARSADPYGPFASCPRNPILTHRSWHSPIQATGHADLLQAHDGGWWLVFLGIRPVRYPPCHHLGRETFLSPVAWRDGWPLAGEDGHTALEVDAALPPSCPWPAPQARDDFGGTCLNLSWNFLRNPHPENWSLTDRPGWLRLNGSAARLDDIASPAFIGRRQRHFDCRVRTLLDFNPRLEGEEAGLTVLMNEKHHYEIAVTRLDGQRCIIVRRRIGSLSMIVSRIAVVDGPVTLGIAAEPLRYRFTFTLGEGEPRILAEGETYYLSKEVAGGFTGVYFGLYATGNGRRGMTPAYFDWFEYEGGR